MLQVQGEGDATEQTEKFQSRENTVLFGADGGGMRREGAKPSQSGIPSGDERGKSDQGWVREEAGHLATATDGAGRERRWLAAGCVAEIEGWTDMSIADLKCSCSLLKNVLAEGENSAWRGGGAPVHVGFALHQVVL